VLQELADRKKLAMPDDDVSTTDGTNGTKP
jgi:hypothetical protein